MSGEVWARETHKSFISSGLRFPPLWRSVGVCGPACPHLAALSAAGCSSLLFSLHQGVDPRV